MTRRIVVNTRMLLKDQLDGIGQFAYQTLKRITRSHPEIEFIFLFDRKFSPGFVFGPNVAPRVVWPPTRHPILYYFWFQIKVRRLLNKLKPDLFLSPDGLLPLGAKCPQLAVIHDINFKHYPQDLPFWTGKFFNYYFPKYIKEAARIATVSEFTKQDLIKEYNADPQKIDLVYNGIDEKFGPVAPGIKQETKKKYAGGKDYFLFVGSLHPRKNIPRLLEAFDQFKKETGKETKLIVVGSWFWGKNTIKKILQKMKFRQDVVFTGRVSNEDLIKITASAYCLTYVPYFEGFGVPLVEAMQSEIPIIAANVTSLPEIAGNAALYVNPFEIEEIKNAMIKIFTDGNLRNKLINNGIIRRQNFSWNNSARDLWACIEKILTQEQL